MKDDIGLKTGFRFFNIIHHSVQCNNNNDNNNNDKNNNDNKRNNNNNNSSSSFVFLSFIFNFAISLVCLFQRRMPTNECIIHFSTKR